MGVGKSTPLGIWCDKEVLLLVLLKEILSKAPSFGSVFSITQRNFTFAGSAVVFYKEQWTWQSSPISES